MDVVRHHTTGQQDAEFSVPPYEHLRAPRKPLAGRGEDRGLLQGSPIADGGVIKLSVGGGTVLGEVTSDDIETVEVEALVGEAEMKERGDGDGARDGEGEASEGVKEGKGGGVAEADEALGGSNDGMRGGGGAREREGGFGKRVKSKEGRV